MAENLIDRLGAFDMEDYLASPAQYPVSETLSLRALKLSGYGSAFMRQVHSTELDAPSIALFKTLS